MFGYRSMADASENGLASLTDRVDAGGKPRVDAELDRFIGSGLADFELEARQLRRDGSPVWTLLRLRRAALDEGVLICVAVDITPLKAVEEKLRFREEEYRLAVRQSDKLVLRYDIRAKTAYLPPESAAQLGMDTIPDMPESLAEAGVVKSDSLGSYQELFEAIRSGERSSGSGVLQLRTDTGAYEWFRMDYSLIYDDEGLPVQAVLSLQNVSEQREKEFAYKKWQQMYASMPQSGIVYLEFDLTRDRLERAEGGLFEPFPAEMEPTLEAVIRHVVERWAHVEDHAALTAFAARERLLSCYFRGVREETLEYRHLRANGMYGWVRVGVQLLPDPYSSDIKAFLLFRDIDSEKCEELNLKNRVRTDVLTGVLNRRAFAERVETLCTEPDAGRVHALVMMDVDHFKRINDRFGHGYGDRVLVRIAETLRSTLRADDILGRIGGDEFILCLKNVASREALIAKMSFLNEQIYQRVSSDMVISGSFGAACYPADGGTFEELYFKADVALYAAKKEGRNCVRVYEAGMQTPDRPGENAGMELQPAPGKKRKRKRSTR